MKAIVYTRYGPPDVLKIDEVEKPSPADDEILIRVRAAEATKSDCELRSFRFPVSWFWLPLRLATGIFAPRRKILGNYFAGEIAELGGNVTGFSVGDKLMCAAGLHMGGYGEFARLPAIATVAPIPSNMSFEEAAAVPLGALNAIHFIRKLGVQAGEKVLINGAGGSIGSFGLQLAKERGAEVTAVDHPRKADMLRSIGADHFIAYTETDFTNRYASWDVIFDTVPGSSYSGCLRALKPGGRYATANPRLSKLLRPLITNRFSDRRVLVTFARETSEELNELRELIEAGKLRSTIDGVYSMDEAAAAHRRVESEERIGMVVISIGGRS